MSTATVIITPSVLLREGISSLLQDTSYKVVATAPRPAELASDCCPAGQQTLAILGIELQNRNLDEVAEGVRLLRSLLPDGKVVLVADTERHFDPQRVLALSSDACILKLGSRDALIEVLKLVFLDQSVFLFAKSNTTTAKEEVEFIDRATTQSDDPSRLEVDGHGLSSRERNVLACLAQGNSNKAIARVCQISVATVKVHLKAILRKTRCQNRTQAAVWAIQHGSRSLEIEDRTPPAAFAAMVD